MKSQTEKAVAATKSAYTSLNEAINRMNMALIDKQIIEDTTKVARKLEEVTKTMLSRYEK